MVQGECHGHVNWLGDATQPFIAAIVRCSMVTSAVARIRSGRARCCRKRRSQAGPPTQLDELSPVLGRGPDLVSQSCRVLRRNSRVLVVTQRRITARECQTICQRIPGNQGKTA
jgi:hypothetical protein